MLGAPPKTVPKALNPHSPPSLSALREEGGQFWEKPGFFRISLEGLDRISQKPHLHDLGQGEATALRAVAVASLGVDAFGALQAANQSLKTFKEGFWGQTATEPMSCARNTSTGGDRPRKGPGGCHPQHRLGSPGEGPLYLCAARELLLQRAGFLGRGDEVGARGCTGSDAWLQDSTDDCVFRATEGLKLSRQVGDRTVGWCVIWGTWAHEGPLDVEPTSPNPAGCVSMTSSRPSPRPPVWLRSPARHRRVFLVSGLNLMGGQPHPRGWQASPRIGAGGTDGRQARASGDRVVQYVDGVRWSCTLAGHRLDVRDPQKQHHQLKKPLQLLHLLTLPHLGNTCRVYLKVRCYL